MIEITAESNSKELQQKLQSLRNKSGSMGTVFTVIGQTLLTSIEENFNKESARNPIPESKVTGGVWKALHPSTIRSRTQRGYTGKMLQVSGQLLASIQVQSSSSEAVVGTNKKYAKVQHENRPFLVVQQNDIQEINTILEKWFSAL